MSRGTRLLVFAFVVTVTWAAGSSPVSAFGPAASIEAHAPISIESDAQLVIPDAMSGNGVRSGSGSAGDPFVIAGWEIEAAGSPAIWIQDVTFHVVVRDVRIMGDGASPGIQALGVPNLSLQAVEIIGTRHGLVATDSGVHVRDSEFLRIQGRDTGPPYEVHTGIATSRGRMVVEDTRFEGVTLGMGGLNARIEVRRSEFDGVQTGVSLLGSSEDAAGLLVVDDVVLRGPLPAFDACKRNTMGNPPRPGILVDPNHVSEARIEAIDVAGFDVGVWAQWSFETTPPAPPVEIARSRIAANLQGVSFSAGSATLRVTDSTLYANAVGVLATVSLGEQMNEVVLTGNRLEANGDGAWLYHEAAPVGQDLGNSAAGSSPAPSVQVRGNDIVENCHLGLRYDEDDAPARLDADWVLPAEDNYWHPPGGSGANGVSPGVRIQPRAAQPFTAYEAPSGGTPAPGPFASGLAVVFLAAALRLQGRRP